MRNILMVALTLVLLREAVAQQTDYDALVRRCFQHEKAAMEHPRPLQFVEREQTDSRAVTRTVIESDEGRVDRLVALNDQPLSPGQLKRQQQRLKKLLEDSEALRGELTAQREEVKRRELLVTHLADAFVVRFSGIDTDGRLRFSFIPAPGFSPKNRETQVLKGMRGVLWIDPTYERISAVQGELFKDVNFGWGILGRLYKGGHFDVVQSQISPGVWRITVLNLDFRGRAFLFTGLRIFQKETAAEFVPTTPGMTIRGALTQLLSYQSVSAGSD